MVIKVCTPPNKVETKGQLSECISEWVREGNDPETVENLAFETTYATKNPGTIFDDIRKFDEAARAKLGNYPDIRKSEKLPERLSAEDILSVVETKVHSTVDAYVKKAISSDHGLNGKISIRLVVQPSGRPRFEVLENTTRDKNHARKLIELLSHLQFGASQNGGVATYLVLFGAATR